MKKLKNNISKNGWLILILAVGISLRIIEFLLNRSLWLDEAALALNIIDKSYVDLFGKLNLEQYAPILYLWLKRFSVDLFGKNEYGLRLPSLVASVIFLWFFYKASLFFLKKEALVALLVVSLLNPLIYFASEAKQYSIEVAATVVIYYILLKKTEKQLDLASVAILIATGTIAVFFSFSSIFILGGIGIGLCLIYIYNRQFKDLSWLFLCLCVWIIAFCLSYFQAFQSAGSLNNFWENAYVSYPPSILEMIPWFATQLSVLIIDPKLNVLKTLTVSILILIGILSMAKTNYKKLLILICPVLLTLFASLLHKYPTTDRLILFLVPIFIIFLVYGATKFISSLPKVSEKIKGMLLIMLLAYLFFYSLQQDILHLSRPRAKENVRSSIQYYIDNKKKNESIYVYYGADPQFRFYERLYNIDSTNITYGKRHRDNIGSYIEEIEKFKGKKVWILFAHSFFNPFYHVSEEIYITTNLDSLGKQLDSYRSRDTSIYFYDLSN